MPEYLTNDKWAKSYKLSKKKKNYHVSRMKQSTRELATDRIKSVDLNIFASMNLLKNY